MTITIRSMTAYGSGSSESGSCTVSAELRTVNSRFLDVSIRMADELRAAEGILREKLVAALKRGKVELRIQYVCNNLESKQHLDSRYLEGVANHLLTARQVMPDVPAPSLFELLKQANSVASSSGVFEGLLPLCHSACDAALADLQANREREGQRLAMEMLQSANDISGILVQVESQLPRILEAQQQKITSRLSEALTAACPEGFSQISGAELSARVAQEASLFSLRADVAEELARLRSHIAELKLLLGAEGVTPDELITTGSSSSKTGKKPGGSLGKRMDFLFQEMNREANTLGSKAAEISITRAAIDLKLLIEQLREQAQNIE